MRLFNTRVCHFTRPIPETIIYIVRHFFFRNQRLSNFPAIQQVRRKLSIAKTKTEKLSGNFEKLFLLVEFNIQFVPLLLLLDRSVFLI